MAKIVINFVRLLQDPPAEPLGILGPLTGFLFFAEEYMHTPESGRLSLASGAWLASWPLGHGARLQEVVAPVRLGGF